MLYRKNLEIDSYNYEPTKQVLIDNGSIVYEHSYGSRKTLYANTNICGYAEMDYYLPLSKDLSPTKFNSFLASFTKSLYSQIKKNPELFTLNIEFDGISRDRNYKNWSKIKSKTKFYNIDLSSAYWQVAYKLGYISSKMFEKYIDKDEYKEAKRYCISFLARENRMDYYDDREIKTISCDISILYQIYTNIRHELYTIIDDLKSINKDWIEYNIDGISVMEKDVSLICDSLDFLNLKYKINECVKIDKVDYYFKGKIRKF
jgi:hypothetical protein